MDYVNLGNTGLRVSRVCLGMMSFGKHESREWALDEAAAEPIVKRAVEGGVIFFHTADVYNGGQSEVVTGNLLRKLFGMREEYVVATKVNGRTMPGENGRGLSRKHVMASIDGSLERLGLDYVDLYQIHRWDDSTPIEETMEALHDIVKAGKARYIGASSMRTWQFAKAQRVDCYAVGNTSMFMASDAQARFSRLGLHSNFYYDAHLQLISAATMSRHDVVLAISHVGRMPFLLESVGVAKEREATIIAMTQPLTPLAKLADIVLPIVVPADPSMRVGTEAYLAQLAYLEILMVGTGLRRGPPALTQLKRIRDVLRERGVDSDSHPVFEAAWSKRERQPL
jgi:D-arabinose 5-phosphate isomerase GutQ